MTDTKDKGMFSSLTMGALTIGTGLAVKWLMQTKNRQKLYTALEHMLGEESSEDGKGNGKISQATQKVKGWLQDATDDTKSRGENGKSDTKKSERKKKE